MARNQQQPSSEDDLLEQLAEEFGIDPSQLGGLGAEQQDPYAIFEGVQTTDQVGVQSRPDYRVGPPLDAQGRTRSRIYTGSELVTASVGEVLKKFYQLSPTTLRRMQALLFAGGFFGDAEIDDIAWGQHDDVSFSAWAGAVARTARLNAAGKDVTYQQVIGDAAWAAGLDPETLGDVLESGDDKSLEDLLGGLAGGEGQQIDVMLSDPNALRATMDRAASAVLGRKANAAEQRMFISMIHDVQRSGQIAVQKGEGVEIGTDPAAMAGFDDTPLQAGDVVTQYTPPAEEADAEAFARQQNPAEAGAHDIAIQFANLLEMLPAPVNVPRLTL